jgi:Lrp/AsnC family transcriptional regulator for asnA, asnC and gidA
VKELDSVDHKLLYHLFLNSRQSLSSIGRKINLHKSVVEYRLKRLIENNIILNFYTMVDFYKLGYTIYRLYFIFQHASPEKEREIIQYFINYKNTWTTASIKGRYDLMVTILVKDHNKFFAFYEDTLRRYRPYFKEIIFSQLYATYGYKRSFLLNESAKVDEKAYEYKSTGETASIDNIDYKILYLLSENARIPTVEISKKLNITSPTTLTRVKKLIKDGIIVRYSIKIDANKLGYKTFIVNFTLRNYDRKNQILNYLSDIPFIWELNKTIGGYDLELTIFSLNFEHFYSMMENLRNKYPEDISNYDYLFITGIHTNNYLPVK